MIGMVGRLTKEKYLPGRDTYCITHYRYGNEHLKNGKYREAIKEYDKAIALSSNHISYFINRGIAKAHIGDKEGAFSDYEKAKALDPEEFERRLSSGLPLLS
jgi:superkiller protein 3